MHSVLFLILFIRASLSIRVLRNVVPMDQNDPKGVAKLNNGSPNVTTKDITICIRWR